MLDKPLQNIYNIYLRASRTVKGKPFKYRKNFDDFPVKDGILLKRIHNMLMRCPHIDPAEYFEASFKLNPDIEHIPLDHFATMAGVKAYNQYQSQKELLPPDSDDQLESVQQSLKFIAEFCITNSIPVSAYITHKPKATYSWMQHLKRRKINLYVLMEFSDLHSIISSTPEDEVSFLIDNLSSKYEYFKLQYSKSKAMRHLVKQGITRISHFVDNNLTTNNQTQE